MNTTIYFFSGTGNSYSVAKDIAQKLNAPMVSIPAIMHAENVELPADVIGIVFPT